jgi:excisionase family DNA binding protein
MSARKSAGIVKCPRLLTVRQAAEYLATTPATIYTRIWRREIPFIKIGRSVRLDVNDLEALIDQGRVSPVEINSLFKNSLRWGDGGNL